MNSPPVPEGWQARWDEQSNQWYYLNFASGVTQWQHPGAEENAASYHPALPDSQAEPNEQSRGFVSTAATGIAAGTFFEHGWSEFKKHHEHHDHHLPGVGAMTGFLGMAGAGAKLFGKKQHSQSPPPQTAAPPQQTTYVPVPVPVPAPAHQYSPPPAQQFNLPPAHQYTPPPPMPAAAYPAPRPTQFVGGMAAGASLNKPPLIIHAAAFAGADVTRQLQALVTADQAISLKGGELISHFGDPWPEAGNYRSLVVLYQYGDRPMEVLPILSNSAKIEISHQPLITERMKFVNSPQSRIISLVWGRVNALSPIRVEKLEKEGELETADLGDPGHFVGTAVLEALPVLVCFYRNDFGGISIASARFQGTMRLPWNPLAKWN